MPRGIKSTLIVLDSNEFIEGIERTNPSSEILMTEIPNFHLALPRIIVTEVTRNLSRTDQKKFFEIIGQAKSLRLEENHRIPLDLIHKYMSQKLSSKGDAVIAAFTEWVGSQYLVSENRDFLKGLKTRAFKAVSAKEFLEAHD